MNFSVVLAILLTVLASEVSPANQIGGFEWRMMSCLTIIFMTLLLAHLQTQGLKLVRRLQPNQIDRAYERHQQVFNVCWICATATILFLVRWPQVVHDGLLSSNWVLLDELLILAPIVIPSVCAWIMFSEVETNASQNSRSPESRGEQIQQLIRQRIRLIGNRIRVELLLVLVPTLLFFVVRDVGRLLASRQDSLAILQQTQYPVIVFQMAMLIGIFAIIPLLIRSIWRSQSLRDTEVGQQIATTCRQMGVRVRDIRLWKTDDQIINSVVVGLLPGMRQILISDGLLRKFSDEEIGAITRHEAAHLRRNHLLGRIAVLCLPVSLYYCWHVVGMKFFNTQFNWSEALEVKLGGVSQVLLLGGAATYGFISLAIIARLFEFDADIFGCCRQTAADATLEVDAQRLRVYRRVMQKMERLFPTKFTWLHPQIAARRRLLAAISRNPQIAGRYLHLGRAIFWLVIVLGFILPAVATVISQSFKMLAS